VHPGEVHSLQGVVHQTLLLEAIPALEKIGAAILGQFMSEAVLVVN